MKKLRLELDTLVVESFGTSAEPGDGGTVFAQASVGNPADSCSGCWYTWPECASPWPCNSMYETCETADLIACGTTGSDTRDRDACSPGDTAEIC